MDVDTLVALSGWGRLDLNDFASPTTGSDYLTKAAAYLRRDPTLTREEASALEQLLMATYSSLKNSQSSESPRDR